MVGPGVLRHPLRCEGLVATAGSDSDRAMCDDRDAFTTGGSGRLDPCEDHRFCCSPLDLGQHGGPGGRPCRESRRGSGTPVDDLCRNMGERRFQERGRWAQLDCCGRGSPPRRSGVDRRTAARRSELSRACVCPRRRRERHVVSKPRWGTTMVCGRTAARRTASGRRTRSVFEPSVRGRRRWHLCQPRRRRELATAGAAADGRGAGARDRGPGRLCRRRPRLVQEP